MKNHGLLFVFSFIILSLIGCSISGEISSTLIHGGITVTKLTLIEDHYGEQHIIGEIRNDNSFPINDIKLKVSIYDANGSTALRDARGKPLSEDLFNPFLSILFPGESSGFDYSLSPLANTATDYRVGFDSAIKIDSQKADVRIVKAQIQKSMYGTSFFIGEITNHGSQPAEVEGLGVTIFGEDGRILDINHATSLIKYLTPAKDPTGLDRGSFVIPLRGSFGNETQWQTYISAVPTDTRKMHGVELLESTYYTDSMGYFHLVGLIANKSPVAIFLPLNGGIFDTDGNVLDSASGYLPIDLQAGTTEAFDLMDWNVVNHNINLQDMVTRAQIQIDPSQISPSAQRTFELYPSSIHESRNNEGLWTFAGVVNNFWPIPFKNMLVIASIFSEDHHIVATNYQWIKPSSSLFGNGRKAQFDFQVASDPTRDPSRCTYQIRVLAVFPW